MSNENNPLSLVIVSGFLGSGKTTLLKNMLDWEIKQGHKPIVIMSEFGELDIDSTLIEREQISIKKIMGGCICCNMKLALLATIDELYRISPGSKVYLETTGVADPGGVLEAITPAINKGKVEIRKVILVYDASLNEALVEDRYMAEHQLLLADAILINRCDTVSPEDCEKASEYVASIKPNTPHFRTVYANVDTAELMETAGTNNHLHSQTFDSEHYINAVFTEQKPLKRNCLVPWLEKLPKEVLRVKGFVRFSTEDGIFEIQAVRRRYNINAFKTIMRQRSVLVIVARNHLPENLMRDLEKCTAE
jgi:G3E family GTPase